jgi:iron(III) transport system permease protein
MAGLAKPAAENAGVGGGGRSPRFAVNPFLAAGVVLALLLAVLVVPPLLFLIEGSFTGPAAEGRGTVFTTHHFARLLAERRLVESATNSAIFAVGSAAVALFFGGLLAWIVERTNTPWRGLAYLTAIISLGTPYVLYVGAWLFLLGKAGPVNTLWRDLTGDGGVLINVYSVTGMTLVEGFLWSPLVFLLMGATLRNANPEFEEAARMSGASVWDTLRRITFRLAMPAVLALALLVFIRALEAFEVPALVGLPGGVNVLTTDIFLDLQTQVPPDMGHASAFSVVLLAVVAVLLYFYGRLSKSAERFSTITGKGFRPRPFDLGHGRWITAAILMVNFLILLVAPTLVLVWASLLPFYQTFRIAALKLLTLDNYRAVFDAPYYLELVGNTLLVAAITSVVVMALTLVSGWLAARNRRGAWLLDQLATFPLVFPGIVLGVAVMQLFLRVPVPVYGTVWILIWAFVIRYLPYGMRYSYSGLLQIHRELEEAAGVAGASAVTTLRRIVMPLLAPSLVAGGLFVFLLAARVLSLPILLAGPSSQTMAVAMYDLWTNGQGTELAALGLLWTALMTVIAGAFYLFARRSATGPFGNG